MCCCVWNYEQFVLSNLLKFCENKKQKRKRELKDKTEQPLPSNLPLLSLLSPLSKKRGRNSYHVTFFTATSRECAFIWSSDIYIYHNIYIHLAYHLSAEFTNLARIYLPWVRAHKQTQRWPRRSATAARRWRRRWWKKIIIAIRLIDLEEDLLFPILTTGWEQQRRTKERTE